MSTGGPGDLWWCNGRSSSHKKEHSAAYRAQQRALRNSAGLSREQEQPQANRRHHQTMETESGASMADGLNAMAHGLHEASVLTFNPGQPNEGIYTQTRDHVTFVLGFESMDDADDFSRLLLNQGFELATPMPWSAEQLSTFCRQAGYEVKIMPRGEIPELPAPPDHAPNDQRGDSPRKKEALDGYRQWLDALMSTPTDCNDDDCTVQAR